MEYVDVREQEWIYLAEHPRQVTERRLLLEDLSRQREERSAAMGALVIDAERYSTAIAAHLTAPSAETRAALGTTVKELERFLNLLQQWRSLSEQMDNLASKPYSYSEVDPLAMFGISGGMVPQAGAMQGPRVSYQASMGKQALGPYLLRPQRSFLETLIARSTGLTIMPNTANPIVCFLAHRYNNEDGLVIKREYLEQNFRLQKYTSHKLIAKSRGALVEAIEKPSITTDPDNIYEHIQDNGLPRIGAYIRQGQCLIGRTRAKGGGRKTNTSYYAGVGDEGYVDRILITKDGNDRVVKVKVRQTRTQIDGDKFAARAAQKQTACLIIPASEMPYVVGGPNDGVTPDFILNPHCIPSRMTMSLMKEIVASKWAAYSGEIIDGTTFHRMHINTYMDKLEEVGLNRYGEENMAHPDGTPFNKPVMLGPCGYQSLRHHVLDKYYARSRGSIKPLSHQPVGGRSREGALRLGEMERDAAIAHGATALITERLMEVSDKYTCIVCHNCGHLAIANVRDPKVECRLCGDRARFGPITFPFIMKLIIHMLGAISISVTLRTRPKVDNPQTATVEDRVLG
jgi:DNA-directed RNA polymerase beta subunit